MVEVNHEIAVVRSHRLFEGESANAGPLLVFDTHQPGASPLVRYFDGENEVVLLLGTVLLIHQAQNFIAKIKLIRLRRRGSVDQLQTHETRARSRNAQRLFQLGHFIELSLGGLFVRAQQGDDNGDERKESVSSFQKSHRRRVSQVHFNHRVSESAAKVLLSYEMGAVSYTFGMTLLREKLADKTQRAITSIARIVPT